MSVRRCDQSTGQVYTERVIPSLGFANSKGPAWAHESPFFPVGWEEGSPVGANSLKHMAMRQTLSDQRRLTLAHFTYIPWPLARYIWGCLCRCNGITLHMWKILATTYPDQFTQVSHHHSLSTSVKRMPFRDYLTIVGSNSLSWGTLMTVTADHVDRSELVDITNLRNLVALDISTPPRMEIPGSEDVPTIGLNDRVIRSWGELAHTAGAFKHLRILKLHTQTELTEHIFPYLERFPSLVAVFIIGCPNLVTESARAVGSRYGWKARNITSPNKSLYEYINDVKLFSDIKDSSVDPEVAGLPLLEFTLATPKPPNFRSSVRQQPLLFKRVRRPTITGEDRKRGAEQMVPENQSTGLKKKRSKPVLKSQPGKDMIGLLAEFQR